MKSSSRILLIVSILISIGFLFPSGFDPSAAQDQPNRINSSTIGVTATTPTAGPQSGVFTITRTVDTTGDLPIWMGLNGTAAYNTDYTLTNNSFSGALQLNASGMVGQAFNFNGDHQYAQFPDDANQDPTAEATLDAWVYFNQLPSDAGHIMTILAKSDFGRDLDLQCETDNKFYLYIGFAHLATVASNTVAVSNTWYHVAATYKANTEVKMYVNGVLENTTPISIARSANGHPVTIGESFYFRGRYFNGRIDEAHMFNRELSDSEVQSIYNAGSAGLCKPVAVPSCLALPPGLVGWWPGDGVAIDLVTGRAGIFLARLSMADGQATGAINVEATGAAGSAGKTIVLALVPDGAYNIDVTSPSDFVVLTGQPSGPMLGQSGIFPDKGGDAGTLTAVITGRNIAQGATAKLKLAGQPDIPGSGVSVAQDSLSMTVTFDLAGKAHGVYDVVVTNPDSTSGNLPGAFTVEAGTATRLNTVAITRPVIRIGNTYPFYVLYGNQGNNDAANAQLYVSVPTFVSITPVTVLNYQVGQVGDRTVITVDIPNVRGGAYDVLTVNIKVADPNQFHHIFQLMASIGDPGMAPSARTFGDWEPGPPPPPPPHCCSGDTDPRTPNDPNDKSGATGFGSGGYLPGDVVMPYAVYFENKDNAALPAQDVSVTDQLDPNLVDLSSFSFGVISFGNYTVVPPTGQNEFATIVDLRPAKQLIVKITGRINTSTGLVRWDFNSLDPNTGQAPDDPELGFQRGLAGRSG